jgi:hypothetical protein
VEGATTDLAEKDKLMKQLFDGGAKVRVVVDKKPPKGATRSLEPPTEKQQATKKPALSKKDDTDKRGRRPKKADQAPTGKAISTSQKVSMRDQVTTTPFDCRASPKARKSRKCPRTPSR